ncbi:cell wall metabolism sensor histidine kinase WalK [Alicyclobacillus sp. SO9]|uniref:sensor histidine kinase n=1 Tax=Alicyclobacillus sp. SO9 TaxID=2665646 RepID=UPI0018E85F09|nr:ATP-binding protein [Alicyclobacillus sp. SO9]QQE79106.1 ATP-binding protein [Alicyclobacillus sp. SO9]
MIARIRFKFTLLTSVLIFVVLLILGSILYGFMLNKSYKDFDKNMTAQARPMTRALEAGRIPKKLIRGDTLSTQTSQGAMRAPLAMFLWNKKGHLISKQPLFASSNQVEVLKSHLNDNHLTISFDGHYYRVINAAVIVNKRHLILQLVRNEDQLRSTLHNLLFLLILGTVIAAALSVFIGFMLADRALIPIRKSWDRQTQFVADASHELRTPLMAIQARAEMLLHNPDKTIDEESEKIGSIYQEAKRVSRLVDNLLTLSRGDSNAIQIEKHQVSVPEVLDKTIDNFVPLCKSEDIGISLECHRPLTAELDDERFRQLLYILLDNAVKYNRPGGKIHVVCNRRGKGIEVTVEDTGIGIDEADIPNVFHRFYRADKARSRKTGGSGLGLSIAKWIVDAHGGDISLTSTPDKGTTVTVVL